MSRAGTTRPSRRWSRRTPPAPRSRRPAPSSPTPAGLRVAAALGLPERQVPERVRLTLAAAFPAKASRGGRGRAVAPVPACRPRARPVRDRQRARLSARHERRRRRRRRGHPHQHGHRHQRDGHHRRRRQLRVLRRARRQLPSHGPKADLFDGDGRRRRGGHRRPPASRSRARGRPGARDGPGHGRREPARNRQQRARPGDLAPAGSRAAAERPRILGARGADHGRAAVDGHHGPAERPARGVVQRQRPAQHAEQLPAGRHRQQLLWHQQPGLLEPGDAAAPRRRGRAQGRDQQHVGRVRTQRRRHDQRGVSLGRQHPQRVDLGVLPGHRPERHGLLQAGRRPEAAAPPQPVRLRARRTDSEGQGILLRRLRGVPPGPQAGGLCQRARCRAAPGHPDGAGAAPDHGGAVPGGQSRFP